MTRAALISIAGRSRNVCCAQRNPEDSRAPLAELLQQAANAMPLRKKRALVIGPII
jgi:hypothetical protein